MMAGPRPTFRLLDAVSLIVGIIIGAGIYENAPRVADSVAHPWQVLALWVAGGVISLLGALCYTELAAAYPRDGGDVIYLSRAYGRWAGFLFGWMQIMIVRPGDIAAMAFVFAAYAQRFLQELGGPQLSIAQLATLSVVLFTGINLAGVSQARWVQNGMTVLKLSGLSALIVAGLSLPAAPASTAAHAPGFPLGVAMVMILFCYGGWNEMAYIAAEIEHPQRNIPRAMVGGLAAVIVLYLLVNFAFLRALGQTATASSSAVAVDLVQSLLPGTATAVVAALIASSALGALNGQILTGARVSYSAGTEYRFFSRLGLWDAGRQTPRRALLLQMVIAVVVINALQRFDDTVIYTASTVYTFYFFSTLAVIVLRIRDPLVERPYRVIGYPVTILLFAGSCLFMMQSAIRYRPSVSGLSLLIVAAGLPLYVWSERARPDVNPPPGSANER